MILFTKDFLMSNIVFILILFNLFQALEKFQTTTKLTTKSGIEQEESLLNESAARETSLQSQIIDLENETKQVTTKTNKTYFKNLNCTILNFIF